MKRIQRIKPSGDSPMDRWYRLVRTLAANLAQRQKTSPRCSRCFSLRFNPKYKERVPHFGCGGCAEVEIVQTAFRDYFEKERRRLGEDGAAPDGQ